ncbi:hypothetical protein F5Y16DRAFT_408762 [Xylariaceae sp. FL0255]|nr:hypothetical protein F5Y16DRAFT_408762 [Xylariaceae sp. FL0255]
MDHSSMDDSEMEDDDSRNTLRQIISCREKSIASILCDIQDYQCQESQKHCLRFLENLECFYFDEPRSTFKRSWINAFEERMYVALSYTWNPCDEEDASAGAFLIESRPRRRRKSYPSPVRNCVFERILKYMEIMDVTLLWIDRHSIPQKICTSTCNSIFCDHKARHSKEAGLRCMDRVYRQSEHPVALLGRPIESHWDLAILYKILRGKFTAISDVERRYQLLDRIDYQEAKKVLKLLLAITDDAWWQRAWIFQESYKGGNAMTLLISHPRFLEDQKRDYETFGDISGELCVNSQRFSIQTTKFCLAFRSTFNQTRQNKDMVDSILNKAGRYTMLLEESRTMTPQIISDVEGRGVKQVWDRLAIVGNCCSFPVRMDIERLQENGQSLSLSMLAMCLLNGEMLDNRPFKHHRELDMTVSEFLKDRSFKEIPSPLEQHSLTFNKGCRFTDVRFDESGIITKGHLWTLGPIIRTSRFSHRLPWVRSVKGDLDISQHWYLSRLSQELDKVPKSKVLARHITDYLRKDASGNAPFQVGENYMLMMLEELCYAIENGETLILGSLNGSEECMAIFIWEGNRNPGLIFTSTQPKNPNFGSYEANDTHRHVSIEVEIAPRAGYSNEHLPHLYVKRWVPGVCFFVGCPRENVVFPWPAVLKKTGG